MFTLEDAIALAAKAHAGQTDKLGQPYILHSLRVMLAQTVEDARIVAVLHDVLEDTEVPLPPEVPAYIVHAVNLLTHQDNEPYETYIRRISGVTLARTVKLADIADNRNPARMFDLDVDTRTRLLKKYNLASKILHGEV